MFLPNGAQRLIFTMKYHLREDQVFTVLTPKWPNSTSGPRGASGIQCGQNLARSGKHTKKKSSKSCMFFCGKLISWCSRLHGSAATLTNCRACAQLEEALLGSGLSNSTYGLERSVTCSLVTAHELYADAPSSVRTWGRCPKF